MSIRRDSRRFVRARPITDAPMQERKFQTLEMDAQSRGSARQLSLTEELEEEEEDGVERKVAATVEDGQGPGRGRGTVKATDARVCSGTNVGNVGRRRTDEAHAGERGRS